MIVKSAGNRCPAGDTRRNGVTAVTGYRNCVTVFVTMAILTAVFASIYLPGAASTDLSPPSQDYPVPDSVGSGWLSRPKRDFDFFGMSPRSSSRGSKGYAKLEWKHCGNKNDDIILRDIQMTPNPIQVPGKVFISFDMDVKENQTAPIKLRVDMRKKIPMLFGIHTWITVPCYPNGLGSCTINDICDTKKLNFGKCPAEFEEQDISCQCPILEGSYSFPTIEQQVPDPPKDIDPILMEGEFRVKFALFKGHKRLTCYETTAVIHL